MGAHRTVTGLLVSLLAAGLLTGCAGTGRPSTGASSGASGGSSGTPSSSPSPSAAPSAPASASTPPSASAPASTPAGGGGPPGGGPPGGVGPSAAAGELTLAGQVEAGVEANCLMLRSGGQLYHLMGGDQNVVKVGNNVVVRGHVAKGVMSYCMQGQPFQVTEARKA
jgi:hypothetical protein